MNHNLLPTYSKTKINQILKNRDLEDIDTITYIEKFLISKRGYVFKIPLPNTPVILLYSGGLDSTIIWMYLMKVYNLIVYPLVLIRKESLFPYFSLQAKSIRYYSKLLKTQYPKLYQPPFIAKYYTPQPKIKQLILKHSLNSPTFLLNQYNPDTNIIGYESWGQTTTFSSVALDYLRLLQIQHNQEVNTVFSASTSSDGLGIQHQTLTAHRLAMLNLCVSAQQYQLQFCSPAIEPQINTFIGKSELVEWAKKNNLDLKRTDSCDRNRYFHCGQCTGCYGRIYWQQLAKYQDKTFYLKPSIDKLRKNLFN
jgi:hypothetical protein